MANMSFRLEDQFRDDFSEKCKEQGVNGSAMIRKWMQNFTYGEKSKYTIESSGSDRDKYITFMISEKLSKRFDSVCAEKTLNKSAIFRKLVEDFCKENEQ